MVLMAEWEFHSVELVSGRIMYDLPLVGFGAQVTLQGTGTMDADLPLLHLDYGTRRALLDYTTPAKYSVVAVRDGVAMGEWIIWSRDRGNNLGPVKLHGAELLSHMTQRYTNDWQMLQWDQLRMADYFIRLAFDGHPTLGTAAGTQSGDIALRVEYTDSGVLRDRTYHRQDGDLLTKLQELSEVDNGFEYTVDIQLGTQGPSSVLRTVRLAYPVAGDDTDLTFEMAAPGYQPAGNTTDVQLVEDGSKLAVRTYAIGSTLLDRTLVGMYERADLLAQGYPFTERMGSWTTVEHQSVINSYARALWRDAQRVERPISVVTLADAYPQLGVYQLGDRVTVVVDPSINYPDGFRGLVRVLGWRLDPPDTGPETVAVQLVTWPPAETP